MTTAKPTAPVAQSGPGMSWWMVGGGLFVLALAAVLAYVVARSSNGHLNDAPAPLIAEGADLTVVEGNGRKDGRSFVLEAPGSDGLALLTAKIAPFSARNFSRIEWTISSPQEPPPIAIVWRTREHPQRNYTKQLRWVTTGVAALDLASEEGWSGTITGVGLVIGKPLLAPLTVASVRIVSPSAAVTLGEMLQDWSAPTPLRGYSVTFPFDAERSHRLAALPAIAIAEAVAFALYLLLAHWRGWRRDQRVIWGIFLAGWLVLDLRWQANLWREALDRGVRYAGKNTTEMHLAAEDSRLFSLLEAMKGALPSTPTRIFLYCDNDNLCARAAYLLYPQNVFRAIQYYRALPTPEEMHGGDHILLLYSRALGYDRERHIAVWRDGQTKPADEVLLQPGALLLRVR